MQKTLYVDFTAQEPHWHCLFVKIKQVYNCYLNYLKYVDSFSCLTPSFRFPFSWRSKREEGTLSVSARKQTDTSVHAQLSRLSLLLPLDPSWGGWDFLPQMAKIKTSSHSPLTLYNVVNACFNPFLCALGSTIEVSCCRGGGPPRPQRSSGSGLVKLLMTDSSLCSV